MIEWRQHRIKCDAITVNTKEKEYNGRWLATSKKMATGTWTFYIVEMMYTCIVFPNVFIYPTLCYNNFSLLQMYCIMSGLKLCWSSINFSFLIPI